MGLGMCSESHNWNLGFRVCSWGLSSWGLRCGQSRLPAVRAAALRSSEGSSWWRKPEERGGEQGRRPGQGEDRAELYRGP